MILTYGGIRGLLIQPYLCQHFFSPSSWCLSVDGDCHTFQIFSENIILRDSEWVRIRSSDKLLVWYRVIVWCRVYLYYIIYYYIKQHFFFRCGNWRASRVLFVTLQEDARERGGKNANVDSGEAAKTWVTLARSERKHKSTRRRRFARMSSPKYWIPFPCRCCKALQTSSHNNTIDDGQVVKLRLCEW